jgi:4-hydroxythreonine-4-phosphate dehydrogenase
MKPAPIAVTMGDPAGIGPEIVARLYADQATATDGSVVLGDEATLRAAVEALRLPLPVSRVASAAEARAGVPGIPLLQVGGELTGIAPGAVDARAGAAAYDFVDRAIELALADDVEAIVTAPISKEALHLAGAPYLDHTEMLAGRTGVEHHAMMLACDELRVVLVTTHLSLRDALAALTIERELAVIRLADRHMRRLGCETPRVAVAGVNPHAGESGLFGDEEERIVRPAIERARDEGIDASGPWPGDTVFHRAHAGEFDVVVAQYHDQGLIPVKLLAFDRGVNVTLGLPFDRTSVDHGTAFDIAGEGRASHTSLRCAFDLARTLTEAPR